MKFTNYTDSVAIYLRKSRLDPDSESIEETLSRHKDMLMKLAAKSDLNITAIYEEVVSGDSLFTRPEMVRLLNDVAQDKYSAVCCVATDRLGRGSSKDAGIILETLQEHNVFIVTPDKIYDLNDEIDETTLDMQSFIARQELKSIKRRLRKGIEKSIESGCHVAEPPYGYRRAYIDKRPTLEICEEEANAVKMVFDMYVNQHMGSCVIAKRLNDMGYKPRKSDRFSRTAIQFYLQNPVYTGKVVWNKYKHLKKKTPSDKNHYVLNEKEKWIVADGLHPAIISQELFDEAQLIRIAKAHPPSFTGELKNPLAGFLYCKNCNRAIQRQFSKAGGSRLLCTTTGCTRSIKSNYVEKYLLEFLKKLLSDYDASIENHARQECCHNTELIKISIRDLKKNLKSLNSQKASLHDLLEQHVYDVNTFAERSQILSEKIRNTENSLKENERRLSDLEHPHGIQETVPILKKLLFYYDSLSVAEKNEIFKLIIKRVYYSHTKEQKSDEFSLEIELQSIL